MSKLPKAAQSAKQSPLELSEKSLNGKIMSVGVAALSLLALDPGSERILTMNRHCEFGEFEETVLTISRRNTARGTSMRFVLTATRSKPRDPALRRRALMLERSKRKSGAKKSARG